MTHFPEKIKRYGWAAGLALAVVVPAVLGFEQARPDERRAVVATVAGQPISEQAFADGYTAYLLKGGLQDSPHLRRVFVDYLVQARLVARAAREEGIAQEAAFRFEQEVVAQKLLLDAYADRMLFDTLQVTDDDLRALFVRANTRVKARHLYARTREQAEALYARLRQGASFEALAREVFADTALANNGGSVGYFGYDEMDPAFEETAYTLKVGEISRPVRTAHGYSIIQVEDRVEQPLLTEAAFVARASQLETYALRRKRTEALHRHGRELGDALRITFDGVALDRLMAQIEGTALEAEGEQAEAWLAAPLLSFGPAGDRRTWTVADLRDRAQYTAEAQRAQVRTREHLEAFVSGLVVRELMMERARAAGLHREPVYAQALTQAMDEWIYRTAKARVTAGVDVPADSVRAYFEAHREVYVVPEKVRVREILTETRAEADALAARLEAASFADLARAHSIRPGADATGGDLGYVTRGQLGRLADPVFAAVEGEVVGPLEVAGRYALLQVGGRQAARPARLEEVRDQVEAVLHRQAADAAFDAYVASLRARYDVAVDEAALAAVRLPAVGRR